VEAQVNLGIVFSKGVAQAQFNLGLLHYRGEGVARDPVEAAENKKAKANLEKLAKRISSAQLVEAKKKVNEWKQER